VYGDGDFIVNLIDRMLGKALEEAFRNRLFANEVMLLPYYVASLNIEHAYYERRKRYEAFEGLCFVDTLDMAEARQGGLFTQANTDRVERERNAVITVIIGNPPYNVGQKSENENNPNRKYKVIDGRIRETYAKDSKATNKNSLSDMYVKFFRWASDRLEGRDGIVCFVSNNGMLHGIAFDGFREHLARDFERIDHFDLRGNARTSGERRCEEGGNVFDDQIRTGIGITAAVCKKGASSRIRYHVVPPYSKGTEKREILANLGSGANTNWQTLTPDDEHTWLVPEHADEYRGYASMPEIFELHTRGLQTARDAVAYDWAREKLAERIKKFISDYKAEVYRHRAEPKADWPDHVNWNFGGERAHGPAALLLRLLTHTRLYFVSGVGIMPGRPPGAGCIAQSLKTIDGKRPAPLSHCDRRYPQRGRDLLVVRSVDRRQDNAAAQSQ
jgi:predicted helicase